MGDVTRIGTETSGDPAYACPHMGAWWPLFKAIVKQDLGLDLEIIQAMGSASASAGTHGPPGTALDLRSWRFTTAQTLAVVARARKYGAPATWLRTTAQGFDPHVHMVLDCPCTSPADYQITAVKQGYNGLGSGGRGGTDTHPKPDVWRNHAQGIALMEADMALSDSDKSWLRNEIAAGAKLAVERVLWDALVPGRSDMGGSSIRNNLLHQSNAATQTVALVQQLAAKSGVDVDEAAIAREVAASVAPVLRSALVDAVKTGGTPEAIADAVVAKLGAALQG